MKTGTGPAGWWAKLTPEERSVEMIKRRRVARLRKQHRAIPSTESPFPDEAVKSVSLSSGTIKQRIEALEAALAALKAEIGL